MFIVTKSYKKNINNCLVSVTHMRKIACCIHFMQVLIVRVWLVPLFVTMAISSSAFLVAHCFVLSVLNTIHVLDLESVCLIPDIHIISKFYIMYYSWHVLYPTCCFYVWIYGMLNKISISISYQGSLGYSGLR